MARHYTTTATLPKDMQELYEITEPLEGGPVFDLPNYRQSGVDFSNLDHSMAETLIARKWPYLRRKVVPNTFVEAPSPAEAQSAKEGADLPATTDQPISAKKPPKPNEKGGE